MTDKKTRILTLVALFIAILCLSMGFAAYTSVLKIQSRAAITPINELNVKFANSVVINNNKVVSYTTSNVLGTPENLVDGEGIIDNSDQLNPKITNLRAVFNTPGQFATFKFYVVNAGGYAVYLTAINRVGNKICTSNTLSSNPASLSDVTSACDMLDVSVTIDGTTNLNQILHKNGYMEIIVTITYSDKAKDDIGAFDVKFENIDLVFSGMKNE